MMSFRKYATPLELTLKPSSIATWLYSFIVVLTLLLIFFLPVALGLQVLLLVSVVAGFVGILLNEWQCLFKQSIKRIRWQEGNEWQLEYLANDKDEARLLGDSVNFSYLVILNFKVEGRRRIRSVSIFKDSLDSDTFRRLRVRLRVDASDIEN